MGKTSIKKLIAQAAIVAVCVAVLIYIALIPSLTQSAADSFLNISVIYGVVAILSMLMLLGYLLLIKKRDRLLTLLFCAIMVVNCGYFLLSISGSLSFALMANRISYFGSAFLPTIMIVIVADVCHIPYGKKFVYSLFAVSGVMFLLAASGGLLTVYYQTVSIEIVDGVTYLVKEYGPLHGLYSIYLFGSFGAMIGIVVYSFLKHHITSYKQAAIICWVVFVNIAVWFVEQMIDVEFEFLCVSYLATELFLVLMYVMLQDYETAVIEMVSVEETADRALPPDMEQMFCAFVEKAKTLSTAERRILQYYIDGYETADIPDLAFVSIHTVKKHNRSIYQKLEIASKDELMLYIELLRCCGRLEELTEQAAVTE